MSDSRIFKAAVKLSPERRAAYLDQACAANPILRRDVESLLRAHEDAGDFLHGHSDQPPATIESVPLAEQPGTLIGPYKLLQQIGEGGMGVVYMAEQQEPVRRKVALKIIKPGMDSRSVIARFEAERQALALMDHQNIARVLDAGTTEEKDAGGRMKDERATSNRSDSSFILPPSSFRAGRPYFVMELVHGVPLTKYCDDRHLTPRQRLELFIPVCHALQHAHQKGIIHRDLKPSNILVTMYDDKPVPKVIDFGVAKAIEQRLTEKTLFTQFGTLVGTFEYMSPEQAEMNAFGVDTRSDVYSLGVVLYELLTGSTPLERQRLREAAYGEIVRLIKEEEPPRPSTRLSSSGAALAGISQQRGSEPEKLTRLVRGELDWIVMRCLEKDRTRRYETANSLARDVERYLKDEPVDACPPTTGYKLRKFARKNKRLLTTAAAFAVLLLLGVAASAWQAVRATQAEAAAVVNEQQANSNAAQANEQRDDAQKQRDAVRALNEKLQRTLYFAHMNLAKNAWDAGGSEQVLDLLEQHRPKPGEADLRNFEWHYLHRLYHSGLLTLKGHTDQVVSVAFSPDHKRLASAAQDGTIKVWDTQTGQELLPLKGHSERVLSIAFSPDGKRLASASGDPTSRKGTVKVWDTQTGQESPASKKERFIRPIAAQGFDMSVGFSPDGKYLAHADGWDVTVWDAQTGREMLTLANDDGALSVTFSPDGRRLAAGLQSGTVKVWDAQTGQETLTFHGHTGPAISVFSVAFSPDGKRLATGARGIAQQLKIWDAQTGQELLTLQGHTGSIQFVAFSPDGRRLVSNSRDGSVRVWDAQTGEELLALRGRSMTPGGGFSRAFSPDGQRLASASEREVNVRAVKLWDAPTGQEPASFRAHSDAVSSVAFSPDGKRLASSGDNEIVKMWDASTGQLLLSLKGAQRINKVAFSPDGKRLAAASGIGGVSVWDAQTGRELPALRRGFSLQVAFSSDGKRLASASLEEVQVWDTQTGRVVLTLGGGGSRVYCLAFSPDGKRLASGHADGKIRFWDTQTGQELAPQAHTRGVSSIAFSPDGKRLASVAPDQTVVRVWDTQTGQETLILKGHHDGVSRVVFSPDGSRLASASMDLTVKVWDAQTGQEALTLKGHTGGVWALAFSADGHRLASGARDGTVRVWDATPLPEK